MTLATDTTLGSYKIESLIGRGGMGEVYLARDTGLNRQVAIKVLPESFAANPERVARFELFHRALDGVSWYSGYRCAIPGRATPFVGERHFWAGASSSMTNDQ